MLLHQFREHAVLRAHAVLEVSDAALRLEVGALRGAVGALQGGGAVLKELLEPAIEDGGLESGLVANGGDRDLVDQVASEQHHFLRCRVVLPRACHRGILRAQFYG